MTTLDLSLDTPTALDMSAFALDLSVVTIESLVARDISAFTERNRRNADRSAATATGGRSA